MSTCWVFTHVRRIFRCFRPALPTPIPFWVKTGSDTVCPHPRQQRLIVHRAGGDSQTDFDNFIIRAVQPNTVDLQSRIDLRLGEEVRAENCSDFSHISPKLRLSCSQVLWYNLNAIIMQQTGISLFNLRRCVEWLLRVLLPYNLKVQRFCLLDSSHDTL